MLSVCVESVSFRTLNEDRVIRPSDFHPPRDPYEVLGLQLSNARAGLKANSFNKGERLSYAAA